MQAHLSEKSTADASAIILAVSLCITLLILFSFFLSFFLFSFSHTPLNPNPVDQTKPSPSSFSRACIHAYTRPHTPAYPHHPHHAFLSNLRGAQGQPHEVLLELCNERTQVLTERMDGSPPLPLPPLGELVQNRPWMVINPVFWILQIPYMFSEALYDFLLSV